MKHEESKLQQQCVAWFRTQYPQYAMLLFHPINEGRDHTRQDRMRQAIHKAEGAVKGVSDLMFLMSAEYRKPAHDQYIERIIIYNGLCIEMKNPKGIQSQEQKNFQKVVEAAGYKYIVVRRFELFRKEVNDYISHVNERFIKYVTEAYWHITKATEDREREKFYKVLGK